tara:strand:- start:575 stop:1282 length:708 start_codon:yes stop_codon:yes gene_type:complete
MPIALPAIGAAAKFIMANGTRAAAGKFSKAAIDKAKKEIAKRDAAISKKASEANMGVKKTQKPEVTRKIQDTKRDARVAKQERGSGKSDALRPPKDEMPLKFGGGGMKSKMSTKGGMAGGKKKPPGMMGGGMMKSKMSTKGGAMGGKKKPPGMKAGGLKPAPEGNKGLKKLPKEVRNKMGFMKGGGKVKPKGATAGGGYKQGGMKSKMATKKKPTKQKVRGAGIARKGVRPAKMR